MSLHLAVEHHSRSAHWAYLRYVLRHKWYVFKYALKLGVPISQAIFHDLSKFSFAEWGPYVRAFFEPDGAPRNRRDRVGSYDPSRISPEFDYAWLHHQRNKHHWQAWCLIGYKGEIKALPMPDIYIQEMVADWCGAGAAQGKYDPRGWYEANKDKIVLHPDTRKKVEKVLLHLCS